MAKKKEIEDPSKQLWIIPCRKVRAVFVGNLERDFYVDDRPKKTEDVLRWGATESDSIQRGEEYTFNPETAEFK